MNIIIQTKHIDHTNDLKSYAKEKIEKFVELLPTNTETRVFLKGKSLVPGKNASCRVAIYIPGFKTMRAKKRAGDIRSSIDLTQEKIERQIVKFKEKEKSPRGFRRQKIAKTLARLSAGATYAPRRLWSKIKRSKRR